MFWKLVLRILVGAFLGWVVGFLAPIVWLLVEVVLYRAHIIPTLSEYVLDDLPFSQRLVTIPVGCALGVFVGAFWPRLRARRLSPSRETPLPIAEP